MLPPQADSGSGKPIRLGVNYVIFFQYPAFLWRGSYLKIEPGGQSHVWKDSRFFGQDPDFF
jgi:hypothetical protein